MSNNDDFYGRAAIQRAAMIDAQMASAQADLAAARANNDVEGASDNVQALANLRAERANLESLYNDYRASQQGPPQRWISDEQRAARQPNEMDSEDMASLVRTSKYSKNFSSEDYNRLRTGLNYYKASRGIESK